MKRVVPCHKGPITLSILRHLSLWVCELARCCPHWQKKGLALPSSWVICGREYRNSTRKDVTPSVSQTSSPRTWTWILPASNPHENGPGMKKTAERLWMHGQPHSLHDVTTKGKNYCYQQSQRTARSIRRSKRENQSRNHKRAFHTNHMCAHWLSVN